MGSLYTRKGSKYIWLKYYQNGRAVRESSGTTKETVAKRMLRVREGDVERGIPVHAQLGLVTFEEAAEDLLNDYRVNGRRSLSATEHRVKAHLGPVFGGRRSRSFRTKRGFPLSLPRIDSWMSHVSSLPGVRTTKTQAWPVIRASTFSDTDPGVYARPVET